MHRQRFGIVSITNVISEESARHGDYASTEVSEREPSDLSEALAALDSDSWDNVDERDGEVLLYPADYAQDYRTGDYSGTTLVIDGATKDVARLLTLWRAVRLSRQERN